jgi:hypothetical protein
MHQDRVDEIGWLLGFRVHDMSMRRRRRVMLVLRHVVRLRGMLVVFVCCALSECVWIRAENKHADCGQQESGHPILF